MTVEIVVPQIGEAVSELLLTEWLKKVGDTIQKGDVLFEIDSDKAIVEVEAFADGILTEILFGDNSTVLPLQVVGILQTGDVEEPAAIIGEPEAAPLQTAQTLNVSPVAERIARGEGIDLATVDGSGPKGRIVADDVRRVVSQRKNTPQPSILRVNASPKAKRLARERGLDLAGVSGSGIGNMIITADLETLLSQFSSTSPSAAPTVPHGDTVPLGKMRERIAQRMTQSKQQVPHFYLMVDLAVTGMNQLRAYCVETLGWERPPTYTDILTRACAITLAQMPEVNRSYNDGGYVSHETVGIGVAVSTENGLVVPVLPDADQHSLSDTSRLLRALFKRTREGRVKPSDLGNKSMTISNLGMFGIDRFVAIIDMPDPMILAVGQVSERVVPIHGQVVIQEMMTLTLSVDHRILDGADGARFLASVKARLENPFDIMG